LPRTEFNSWRIVHDSESANVEPLLRPQRGARIEANVGRPSDQGLKLSLVSLLHRAWRYNPVHILCKAPISVGVRNNHGFVAATLGSVYTRKERLLRTIAKLHAHIVSSFEEKLNTCSRLHSFVTSAHGFHGHGTHKLTSST
jgi:hypothetical protein